MGVPHRAAYGENGVWGVNLDLPGNVNANVVLIIQGHGHRVPYVEMGFGV